ncbi:hypothetical protein OZX74_00935 [Bifidobacterium sp. ESL0798]|uniref:DUF6541 family protein n=1 Tax=Bifidobacterium sp. ESL0798 TaxID=2983235 RepID=UPI0023F72527|nr:DUF6541 family protein [Bifidobacterium sp. ESL0798]WEV74163.1 hypothetical protein OZX74_00935 [Bifidobacterium sp. ESL0798]
MNTKWKQRIGRAALPICSVLGVLAAFGIVLAWFPKTWDAWNLPLQEIDAPAHYYFIRKLLHQGVGAATRLWPNDAYYPPLFHLLAAALVSLCNACISGSTSMPPSTSSGWRLPGWSGLPGSRCGPVISRARSMGNRLPGGLFRVR